MSLTHSVQTHSNPAHSNPAHSNPAQDAARTMPLHVPSPQSKKLTAEEAWRKLRMPFVLPAAAASVHQCKWVLIDVDCAGCVLCGRVHLCSASTCTEIAHTEGAVVCLVTGLCVQPKTFAVTEYSDNVIVFSTLKDRYQKTILEKCKKWRIRIRSGVVGARRVGRLSLSVRGPHGRPRPRIEKCKAGPVEGGRSSTLRVVLIEQKKTP